jgi:uncharacterized protein YwqG
MKTAPLTAIIMAVLVGIAWYCSRYRKTSSDVTALTKHLLRPAISVKKSILASKSYFGGTPPAHPSLIWPMRDGHALSFLACVDCSELPPCAELDWLPQEGTLLFFYDMIDQAWGFDPKDRGFCATIYLPPSSASSPDTMAAPTKLPDDAVLPKRFLKFSLNMLPPSWETPELAAVGLNEQEMDAFMEYRSSLYGEQPHHQIGGYADPVQNPEMDEECQLVTNGLYCGDETGYKNPRAVELRKHAADWSLLFQMDSDDDLKVMWGDVGMIYFWIRRDDARAKKFDRSWLVFQCG